MTIKFWKNWQKKRLKETKCIILYHLMFADDWENNEYISSILKAGDIISYNFNKDNVKISILDYNMKGDRVPVTMTLKRIDIKTVIFDKYKK